MREVGGSGLVLGGENLLSRTMRTLRPPTLRDGETLAQHRQEIAGCAGIALEAFKPKDAVEAMIASQAIALHFASMECSCRAMLPEQTAEVASRLRKDASNSARTMVDMAEALDRRRGKASQVIRVEKMLVTVGGQAVVGNVTSGAPSVTSRVAQQTIGQSTPPLATGDAHLSSPVMSGGRGSDDGG